MRASYHRLRCVCLPILVVLAACPVERPPAFGVSGTVLDDSGNAVRATRVRIQPDGADPFECDVGFGSFRCVVASRDVAYTLTLERGAEVYREVVSFEDGECRPATSPEAVVCTLSRPFTVTTAAEGGCSPDTLPLLARLVSPAPPALGAVDSVSFRAPPASALLPADLTGVAQHNSEGATEQFVYASPGLPADTTLTLDAEILANGAWCAAHGGWSRGMRLHGEAVVEFRPQPGSDPCSYEPIELRIGPENLVDCLNWPD